ncbi:hypothetical protein PRIPAC_96454 [Pristionchus pacificus]|uniref:G protein-coupled receptor n=1 Tax=Pristionchus pacificus TaxID=54126 RepID=A0A2A6D264_PRIPA|nr:hypothetical protein PRIPAC_96454 [Pristionchus pacificus]|eukprot:PDM84524.1 G protein-coupled receptor [Pristionchus pacificus]
MLRYHMPYFIIAPLLTLTMTYRKEMRQERMAVPPETVYSTVNQWLPIWEWPSLPEYNCSRVRPIGVAWTSARGVSHPIYGYSSIIWGIILYVPCMFALFKERRHACYRVALH